MQLLNKSKFDDVSLPGAIKMRNEGAPIKTNGLYGERRSQDTVGIFRLREMEHCILCLDERGCPRALLAKSELEEVLVGAGNAGMHSGDDYPGRNG